MIPTAGEKKERKRRGRKERRGRDGGDDKREDWSILDSV